MHRPSNDNCPKNADPRNESCSCEDLTLKEDEEMLLALAAEIIQNWAAEEASKWVYCEYCKRSHPQYI